MRCIKQEIKILLIIFSFIIRKKFKTSRSRFGNVVSGGKKVIIVVSKGLMGTKEHIFTPLAIEWILNNERSKVEKGAGSGINIIMQFKLKSFISLLFHSTRE